LTKRHLENVAAAASIFDEKLNRNFEVSRQGSADFSIRMEPDAGGATCIAATADSRSRYPDCAGLFGDPPFRELAIGFGNCHGPGVWRNTLA